MTIELDVQKIYSELNQVRRELGSLRSSVDQLGQVIRPQTATAHAHIIRIPGVHGGRPVVRGTGVSVQTIAEQSQLGRSPQQIVEDFEDVLTLAQVCLLYTSDAADERSSVDLGGRRIIKKKQEVRV